MTTNQHVKHLVAIVLTLAAAIVTVIQTSSPWAHAAWVVPLGILVKYLTAAFGDNPSSGPPAVAFLLFAALGAATSSCAHVPAPAADCKQAALALLGDVGLALAQENYAAALDALVTDAHGGICAVEEAVQIVAKQSADNAGASGDELETLKARRAKLWLASHGGTAP